jgi:hypothetical protein
MGATMQSSYTPFVDAAGKSMFYGDMWGSGAVLSEAYVAYKIAKTDIKIGRQFIASPLVGGSGSRLIKQSFEGATIVNTDLPNTTLVAGAVTKFQNRTASTATVGDIARFNELDADHNPAFTLFAVNKSVPGLTLKGQFATISSASNGLVASNDLGYNQYYAEAEYAGKAGSVGYNVAGQYLYMDWDKYDSTNMYGVKVGGSFADLKAYVAYSSISKNDNDKNVGANAGFAGVGAGTQPIFTKGYNPVSGTYTDETDAYAVDANYNFKNIGLLVGARYSVTERDNTSTGTVEASYSDFYAVYNFTGALKGLVFDLCYLDKGKDIDGSDLWFKAIYKF